MSATSDVPCRYYAAGACSRGSHCPFSHSAPLTACKYFAAGHCTYGDRCRYDHVKPSRAPVPHPAAAAAPLPDLPDADAVGSGFAEGAALSPGDPHDPTFGDWEGDGDGDDSTLPEEAHWGGLFVVDDDADEGGGYVQHTTTTPADVWAEVEAGAAPAQWASVVGVDADADAGPSAAACLPLCGAWTATGACARGGACRLAHGDPCETCGRYALHPTDEAERAAHAAECAARHARLAEVAASAAVECGICMELVLAKARPGDRRFGLMACDHAFCLPCIRGWRSNTAGSADVDTAVRTCPICRTPSPFVTPSATWPASAEAKAAVVDGYKASLARIDCKWFAQGQGACPFGTSCFYRHATPDGVEVDREAALRWVGDDDGVVKPMSGLRIGDFLEAASASRRGRR